MSLQAQLEGIRKSLESRMPAPALDIMHRATDDLIASGLEDNIAAIGSAFPSFVLTDQEGAELSLASLLEKGPLAITFYRGLWCPYCADWPTWVDSRAGREDRRASPFRHSLRHIRSRFDSRTSCSFQF